VRGEFLLNESHPTRYSAPRVLGIIPARRGSKGIPKKNLAPIAGRPLISYTFEQAALSQRLDRVILSTDDEDIAALGREWGVDVPFIRPSDLAGDTATLEPALTHALDWLSDKEGYLPDAFAILQPPTPLRTAAHIDGAIALLDSSEADAVVSVSPPMEHPNDMVYFEGNQLLWVLSETGYVAGVQREGYSPCYFVNGAVYVTRVEAFRRTNSRFGDTTIPYLMDTLDSIDIDTQSDLIIAELLLRYRAKDRNDLEPASSGPTGTRH